MKVPVIGLAFRFLYRVVELFVSTLTSCDLRAGAQIGERFLVHSSRGVLITDEVEIGDDCVVNSGVCIVNKANNRNEGVPRIGHRVVIGAGAKVIGAVTVGDDVVIGSNAVVLADVPSWSLAVGVPAKIKPRTPRSSKGDRLDAIVMAE